ncbi:hypothetical protein C4J83_3565 [Pseudomonas sp. LBUM920]|nr:hypothetical protein C4J83_3565 [Pseudomonas sp. LBUM920]
MSLNRILQQQNGRGAGAKRRIVPGRFDHMSGHMVGAQGVLRGPLFDQDKTVRVADHGVQIVVQTAMLGPDQWGQFRERCTLLGALAGLRIDYDDKPHFI